MSRARSRPCTATRAAGRARMRHPRSPTPSGYASEGRSCDKSWRGSRLMAREREGTSPATPLLPPPAPCLSHHLQTECPMRTVLALLSFASLSVAAPARPQAPLDAHQSLAKDVYKQLIETNTSVMTAGTTDAAQAMARRFRAAGFPDSDVFLGGVRPDKFNVVLRYHGAGGAASPKPLLLLAHIDVVEALKSDWSNDLDPFKFLERDGYYYGRGTSDDKAMAAIFVANIIRLRKEGYVPDRDIIVALTADEEGGCCNGARWLLSNHRELVDASVVLNEGGGGSLRNGKPFVNLVQATEKVSATFTVTARNKGGHSSVPRPDNAIYELSEALVRFSHFAFPVQFNDVTRAYFDKVAAFEPRETGAAMRALLKNPNDAAASAIVSRDPRYNSQLRTTCVATMLTGGHATNALPQTAEAKIN